MKQHFKAIGFAVIFMVISAQAAEMAPAQKKATQQQLFLKLVEAKKEYLTSINEKTEVPVEISLVSPPPEDPANPELPPNYGVCGFGEGCTGAYPGDTCDATWVHGGGTCYALSGRPNSDGQIACECVSR